MGMTITEKILAKSARKVHGLLLVKMSGLM